MEIKIQIVCNHGHEQITILSPHDETYKCAECGETLFKSQVINGYVYILSNPAMHGLVKIGYAERDVKERVKELNNTGIPSPFEIEAIFESSKPYQDEQKIHNYFSNSRFSENPEFFKLNLKEALNSISEIISKTPCYVKKPGLIFSEDEILEKQNLEKDKTEQKRIQERISLMNEFDVTEDELNMIEAEITIEDRAFYREMSTNQILRIKVWEYKNW